MPRPRKLCLLHGKKTKPHLCSNVTAELVHSFPPDHNFTGECKVCGDCCTINVPIREPKKSAAIREILKKGDVLREIGIDPNLVVSHIRKTGELPLRGDLEINEHPHGLTKMHCAVLVPEKVVKKQINSK